MGILKARRKSNMSILFPWGYFGVMLNLIFLGTKIMP